MPPASCAGPLNSDAFNGDVSERFVRFDTHAILAPSYAAPAPSGAPRIPKRWSGQTISQVGSRIRRDGLPYTAVLKLQAAYAGVSMLQTSSTR